MSKIKLEYDITYRVKFEIEDTTTFEELDNIIDRTAVYLGHDDGGKMVDISIQKVVKIN